MWDKEKTRAIEGALSQIDRQFGKGAIMRMDEEGAKSYPCHPTGILSLDVAMGIGGLPVGRVVEIYGKESSGKTTVASIFSFLKIPVYYADQRAKDLYVESEELKSNIVNLVGEKAYIKGVFQPAVLSEFLKNHPQKWPTVNQWVHPLVKSDFESWLANKKSPYAIKEAAILFETGGEKNCDFTILVTAPKEVRIKRVEQRSGLSQEEILGRMDRQWPDKEKEKLADFVIVNDGSQSLIKQVLKIHESIIQSTSKTG